MAGIGFVLRKLYKQDNLSGLFRASVHSAFAATGPWIFTVVALGILTLIGRNIVSAAVLFDFRIILIYNFSFSLVISGPVFMIATRYLADSIHKRDVTSAPGMLIGALILLWGIDIVIAGSFYFLYANLPFAMAISAVINFLLLSAVWLIGIFISALKNYQLITRAFIYGMLVAVASCLGLARHYGAVGMLNGFSVGASVIIALLAANVLAEYPSPVEQPFAFIGYFRKYWEIALSGLVYNMAVWIDKWIMWFAPEAIKTGSGLVVYPAYDSAMFIAYLTMVPAMAMFIFNAETHFFERYMKFYREIEGRVNFTRIQKNHQAIIRSIFGSAGYFFLLQGAITLICVIMAPEIIDFIRGNYMQVGILRYGLFGALFNVMALFLLILLSYFDCRRTNLSIQLVFLLSNALFTIISMRAGFQYYGYGYFIASLITFILAAIAVTKHMMRLPYHTFITNNASIRIMNFPPAKQESNAGGSW